MPDTLAESLEEIPAKDVATLAKAASEYHQMGQADPRRAGARGSAERHQKKKIF